MSTSPNNNLNFEPWGETFPAIRSLTQIFNLGGQFCVQRLLWKRFPLSLVIFDERKKDEFGL